MQRSQSMRLTYLSTCIHRLVAAAVIGVAGLISSTGIALAQESSGAHGGVKGIVKSSETGAPIAGARLSITRPDRAVTSD
jgi:hypothetical protein